ncbi:MAG TPA: diaminopimelate epimerase [Planctomycetaceae bacterium]|jgi:diaminopimelate epimerase|nr:diaminopimelate epimerase [Rhodopirellula sp.]MCH2360875.1 diaminopimelate epimerase [Pirellulales bacterium]HAL14813.1 diaminopimelate epimerase [Planctomycetaceae bacterium]HCK71076.1 diaminopimelate epimerase [Planctomycetaceae bacterium]|tara:strand:+ start:3591 stop:4427 length:837 start_codon:yes stop_codon:yes gene_type:complete
MQFTKMHGAGNDYVYIDCFAQSVPENAAQLARDMSHRRFGIGGDGLILIRPSETADARMQMFNADGSEAEMCGNGIRCVAKYVYDHGICQRDHLSIETGCGVLEIDLEIENEKVSRVRVDMGEPILNGPDIPTAIAGNPVVLEPITIDGFEFEATCVSMGNPHCIIFVDDATDDLVLGIGPRIETNDLFPAKVNVEFVEVVSTGEVNQRTWERGSGETWACGTGASAVCVAGVLAGKTDRTILNHLLGGDLELHWDEQTNHVFMTGPATEVFTGMWES